MTAETASVSLGGYSVSGSFAIPQGSSTSSLYAYNFPANGIWLWTTLSGQANPGLAFEYESC